MGAVERAVLEAHNTSKEHRGFLWELSRSAFFCFKQCPEGELAYHKKWMAGHSV